MALPLRHIEIFSRGGPPRASRPLHDQRGDVRMTANDDDYVLLPATAASANSHNRFMVLAVALSVFLVQYSQSQAMIAPFLPASRPGLLMGPDLVGVAFSAYPLATAIVTPLPPKLLRHMGLRAMVMLGLCISSAANFAACIAGSLASESWAGVLDFCLILSRALGGAGAALSESGCLTAVSTAGWGEDMGKALSAVEITTGVGAALGAALLVVLHGPGVAGKRVPSEKKKEQ